MSAATIECDVDCLACGYNLRGLRGDGACPECGEGVARSLGDRGLEGADAEWRGTLRRGVAVGALEYVAMMVCVTPGQVVNLDVIMPWVFVGMALSSVLGAWWVTRREPGRTGGWLGAVVRGMAVVMLAGYALCVLVEKGRLYSWERVVSLGFLGLNAVKTGLQMGVLAGLARRAKGRGLARAGRWMVGVGTVVWAAMLIEQWTWTWPWLDWTMVACVALASLGVVAYSGWFYVVLRGRRAG